MDRTPEDISSNQPDFPTSAPSLPAIIQDPVSGKRFRIGKLLGQGGFAKCYHCTDVASGAEFCCKAIYNLKKVSFVQRNQMNLERDIQKSLSRHPHIVKYYGRFAVGDHLCMILELCTRGTLLSLLMRRKRLTEPEVKCLARHFCHALIHMQENDVLHRDLKLANLLLTTYSGGMILKVGDFGLAANLKSLSSDRRWTLCGTPNFLAPEVIDGTDSKGYGFPADVWSLGVVIYVMLIGSLPFASDRRDQLFRKIQSCDYQFPSSIPLSDEATDLIQVILQVDPASRPSLTQILDHAFFTTNPGPDVLPFTSLSHPPSQDELSSASKFSKPVFKTVKAQGLLPSPSRDLKRKRASLRVLQANDLNKPDKSLNFMPFNDARFPAFENLIVCPKIVVESPPNTKSVNNRDGFKDKMPEIVGSPSRFNIKNVKDIVVSIKKELDFAHKAFKTYCYANGLQNYSFAALTSSAISSVYVTRWIDSAELLGLGYELCHGVYGLLFNDMSSLICYPGIPEFKYISQTNFYTSSNELFPSPDAEAKHQAFSRFTKTMNKLNLTSKHDEVVSSPSSNHLLHLSRVIKNPEAIIFVFNSQTVQFNFKVDHIRFILNLNENDLVLLLPNRKPLSFSLGSGDFTFHFHSSLADNLRTKLQYCLDNLITLQKDFLINSSQSSPQTSRTLI